MRYNDLSIEYPEMSDLIIACKERTFHFGFLFESFERCIPLDQVWISPSSRQSGGWKFESGNGVFRGSLIHMGSYLESSPIRFSHKGVVFICRQDDKSCLGFFLERIVYRIQVSENAGKFLERTRIKQYPPKIERASYSGFYRYKRKIIYIIDPAKFAESDENV